MIELMTYEEMQHDGRFFDIVFSKEEGEPVEMVEAFETFEDGSRVEIPGGTELFGVLKGKFGNCWKMEDWS
jgi:hypothetical protein